jgi:F-type H+-transporting ATPase subunit b
MADILTMLATGADGYAEPAALGLDSYQWVALAMSVLIAVFVWKKVPGMITGGLDSRIADIRTQLDEAKALRAEADSDLMVTRRQRMAEDKIAAAERAAVAEVKARAVTAAAAASRKLIAERHDSAADRKLADEVIASL